VTIPTKTPPYLKRERGKEKSFESAQAKEIRLEEQQKLLL